MTGTATEPARPGDHDADLARDALERVKTFLGRTSADPDQAVRVRVDDGDEPPLALPRSSVELLARILVHMAAGESVSVVPRHAELTTQQAADMVNVSRPFLIGLLDAGKIEYRMVGTHRRILASSLMEYQREDDARRRDAADELSSLTRELGLD